MQPKYIDEAFPYSDGVPEFNESSACLALLDTVHRFCEALNWGNTWETYKIICYAYYKQSWEEIEKDKSKYNAQ